MQDKLHIEKNTVSETLIIPLYTRKLCTELFPSLYRDDHAASIIGGLDYDFSDMQKKAKKLSYRFSVLEVAARQTDMEWEIKDYLKSRPKAAVVNLGCGLDETGERCMNEDCRVYNVDFESVINLRNRLIPEGERVKNISCDLMDTSWFDEIDTPSEDGAIFFAAGVFYYLKPAEVHSLVNALERRSKGGVLVFDSASDRAVRMMVKSTIKSAGIDGVDAYFSVTDVNSDISPWLENGRASSRGYMLGYNDLKDPSVGGIMRLMAKIGDRVMKLKIVKIEF